MIGSNKIKYKYDGYNLTIIFFDNGLVGWKTKVENIIYDNVCGGNKIEHAIKNFNKCRHIWENLDI